MDEKKDSTTGNCLGCCNSPPWTYDTGRGVPEDDAEAVKRYREVASKGVAQAMHNLGVFYAQGLGGLPKDEAQAIEWYLKAAALGNEDAKKAPTELGVTDSSGAGRKGLFGKKRGR